MRGNAILVAAFAICGWVYIIKTDYLGIYSEITSIFGKFAFLVPFAIVFGIIFFYFIIYKKLIKFIYRKILQKYYGNKYSQKVIVDRNYIFDLNHNTLQQR